MPKMSTNATATNAVRIEPAIRRKLVEKLQKYQRLDKQFDALSAEMDKINAEVSDIREELGEMSIKVDGFTVTYVAGTYKKFNKEKFVRLGGNLALFNDANETKPKKAFNRITVPGKKNPEDGGR